ncbi:MAG: histidine kinase dimerization/phospho-acceptor domain-containing protein [Syntrophobacteraceae bacterium]|nr:histidine kinase dimerization/phospho-acceptor domain-containing protein [Syntrophobacteraceae bacterium]
MAKEEDTSPSLDFKGLGYSKVGHFKQVRSKIKELEDLSSELAHRHSEVEAIINNMTDGLTILDGSLDIVFVNKVQQKMFPRGMLVGAKCHRAFYNKKDVCKECPALLTIKKGETLRGEMVVGEGEFAGRCIEWATSPVRGLSDKIDRVILLMRDITERKEYEFNLMRADRMAAIGLLAAGIAHEINNPLTSIAGFSEGLLKRLNTLPEFKDSRFSSYFKDYLQIINDEAYRCRDIIQSLIRFSHKSKDHEEVLDVNQVIGDITALIRQHAKDNGIKIDVRGEEEKPGLIVGNESELKHLFLNLLSNALEITEDTGMVTVCTKNLGNQVSVVISNADTNGEEMRAGTLQPPPPTPPGIGGTPLSLSICYSIMQHHNGDIQVVTTGQKGMAFILRFPAANQ